jgi:branched-chain amino acid aminotransferase
MTNSAPKYAWLNGDIVEWDKCVLHARTQGAFWGANVFEGVRAYWNQQQNQLYLYRIPDHLARLRSSMKCLDMPSTFSDSEITDACIALLQANSFREDVHLVITPYFGMGRNFDPLCYTEDTGMHITALPMPRSQRYYEGVKAGVSSWRRISDDTMPPRIKTGANYHNSRLAQHEAIRHGHDTAIFLNGRGTVAECPGSCIVMYHKGVISTPLGTSGVLEGITVAAVEEIVRKNFSLPFERREIDRTELYLADELFLCGTLSEIQPIIKVDGKSIGAGGAGPITVQLQKMYELQTRNASDSHLNIAVYN